MPDLGPNKKKIAQLFRMLGSTSDGERRNAFTVLVRLMQSDGISWTDIGDVIANGGGDDGKYTETEMCEIAQAARAEGVEAGIRMGAARGSNDHLTLPGPLGMAEYCRDRLYKSKDDKQRDFVSDMFVIAQRRTGLSLGRLGYLASIYIQIGGKT